MNETHAQIASEVKDAWNTKFGKMNWMKMEDLLVKILNCENLTNEEKVDFSKETIDAFTKRGHFMDVPYISER